MSAGMGFVMLLDIILPKLTILNIPVSSIVFWCVLVGIPVLIVKFSPVKCVNNESFVNSEGKPVDVHLIAPNPLIIFVVTLIIIIVIGAIMDAMSPKMPELLSSFIISSIFFFIPTIYFVIKNCPISLIFSRAWWAYVERHAPPPDPNRCRRDTITDASYSFLSSNIHHRKRH
jgi:hypothetical protein